MSEDDFSDGFSSEYVRLEDPNMEINIKSLMGTTLNIKVSPKETIADVKRKIYRIEGEYFVNLYQLSTCLFDLYIDLWLNWELFLELGGFCLRNR